jgi:hypothetical protein
MEENRNLDNAPIGLVSQIILDKAILDENMGVLYDYYANRSAFGREQSKYIKSKIESRYPDFLSVYENKITELFGCLVVDGFFLSFGSFLKVKLGTFLHYFRRTRMRGLKLFTIGFDEKEVRALEFTILKSGSDVEVRWDSGLSSYLLKLLKRKLER